MVGARGNRERRGGGAPPHGGRDAQEVEVGGRTTPPRGDRAGTARKNCLAHVASAVGAMQAQRVHAGETLRSFGSEDAVGRPLLQVKGRLVHGQEGPREQHGALDEAEVADVGRDAVARPHEVPPRPSVVVPHQVAGPEGERDETSRARIRSAIREAPARRVSRREALPMTSPSLEIGRAHLSYPLFSL